MAEKYRVTVSLDSATLVPVAGPGEPITFLKLSTVFGGDVKKSGEIIGDYFYILQNGNKFGVFVDTGNENIEFWIGKNETDLQKSKCRLSFEPDIDFTDMQNIHNYRGFLE